MKENGAPLSISFVYILFWCHKQSLYACVRKYCFLSHRLLAFRKAEKEEERRAREKIRQKLEEDKVLMIS